MSNSKAASASRFSFQNLPLRILAPLPLPLIQPILQKIVSNIAIRRPKLFMRLGPHQHKTFLIDPVNIPFILLLKPDPIKPKLTACRRRDSIPHDARISGTFLTLLDMIDGRLDGDALFFSRDLIIDGDTEAVVVLRNALDDLDGSIVDDLASQFGPVSRIIFSGLHRIRI